MTRRRARLVLNPTMQLTAAVDVSRRHVGRRRVEVSDERIVRFLFSKLLGGGPASTLDAALRRQLLADGILVRSSDVPRDVFLDPRLDSRSRDDSVIADIDERVFGSATRCVLHRGPGLPPGVAPQNAEPFLPDEQILWVFERGSRIALPYTLAPEIVPGIRALLSGRVAHARMRRSAIAALQQARALDDLHATRDGEAWRRQIRLWRDELRTHGYAVLRDLFPPTFANAASDYYRRLDLEGYLPSPGGHGAGTALLHDEPLVSFLGAQLQRVVRRVTGASAPWTFSYLRVFRPHAGLARHRDHAVCRWNVDLVVGGDPVPDRRRAWPLWIEGRRGPRAIRLGLGDGVLYRGAQLPHWRSAPHSSRTTMMGCLHYGSAPRA